MTFWFIRIYQIAVQEHHHFGYIVGGTAEDCYRCDRELLRHMCEDCDNQSGKKRRRACFVTDLIYIAVRMFGRVSFPWRKKPLPHPEVKGELERKQHELETGAENPIKWLTFVLDLLPLILFSFTSYLTFKALPLYTGLLRDRTQSTEPCQENPPA